METSSDSPASTAAEPKDSWSDIEKIVHKSRMQQYQASVTAPSNFTFHRNLLIFLGVAPGTDAHLSENSLLYVNIEKELWQDGKEDIEGSYRTYEWHQLLDPEVLLLPGSGDYSKEEELLRERKRVVSHGVTSYDFHAASGRILFHLGPALYVVDVNPIANGLKQHATPILIPSKTNAARIDAKLCPSDANIISFIRANDLWVVNTVTGAEMRLTFVQSTVSGRRHDDNAAVSAGVPAYVIQEEFDRFTGYWWEPAKKPDMEGSLEVHKLLYEVTDERAVEELHILSSPDANGSTRVDTYRYPKAGTTNAHSSLRIIEFCYKASTTELLEGSVVEYELRVDLLKLFPWVEYIVRSGWMPDGKHIWAQVMDRLQTRLAIIRIPCTAFRPINSSQRTNPSPTDKPQHKIDILLEETSDIWINVNDCLHLIPSPRKDDIEFLWLSQETGFRHLNYVKVTTQTEDGYISNPHNTEQTRCCECVVRQCQTLKKIPLTEGDWDIKGDGIWVDERNQLIYFMAYKDTPLETHLYSISTASEESSSTVKRLTAPGFSHNVSMSSDCSLVVIVSSSVDTPAHSNICKVLQKVTDDGSSLVGIGWLDKSRQFPADYTPPELFSYTNSHGYEIHGLLYKPNGYVVGEKYPTLLFVYGGPGVQLVTNSQRAVRRLSLHSLTTMGYVVVMLDTMGSANRGIEFEASLKDNLGCIEVEEQVEGLRYIAEQSQIIDMDRVAIHGWSYGGYVSLMALAKRPDVFKVAIAGAPVTNWELYDTGYTERYMDLPNVNRAAYRRGSILNNVPHFPNEQNRLLIIHGLIDENVHFSHTNALISELVKEGKPYQLQVYPGERHGIRSPTAAKHYETYVFWFLQQTLGGLRLDTAQ